MLIKTRGIVFKTLKYGETSIIADIFTEELGLKKYIFNGVRSKKPSVKPGLLQLMSLVDILVYEKQGVGLQRVKEISPAIIYSGIPFDLIKSSIGLFILEISRKILKQSDAQQAIFQFLFQTYSELDQIQNSLSNFHLNFLIGFSSVLGFIPNFSKTDIHCEYFDLREGIFTKITPEHLDYLKGEDAKLFFQLLNGSDSFSRTQKQSLLEHLILYFELQTDSRLNIQSHLIFREIL
jgi:DNA repair protein RecO (recombination protein O)